MQISVCLVVQRKCDGGFSCGHLRLTRILLGRARTILCRSVFWALSWTLYLSSKIIVTPILAFLSHFYCLTRSAKRRLAASPRRCHAMMLWPGRSCERNVRAMQSVVCASECGQRHGGAHAGVFQLRFNSTADTYVASAASLTSCVVCISYTPLLSISAFMVDSS